MLNSPEIQTTSPIIAAIIGCAIIALPGLAGCQTQRDRNHSLDSHMFLSAFIPYQQLWIEGEVDPDNTPEGTFVGETLHMQVREASSDGARIAFHVGEDTSRTWVLTKQEDGRLHLRHDHRDPDGTPHELTDYGGYGTVGETWNSCSFHADEATIAMIPAAATNIWTMTLDFDNDRFIYNLTRHGRPRFRAVFDLTTATLDRPHEPSGPFNSSAMRLTRLPNRHFVQNVHFILASCGLCGRVISGTTSSTRWASQQGCRNDKISSFSGPRINETRCTRLDSDGGDVDRDMLGQRGWVRSMLVFHTANRGSPLSVRQYTAAHRTRIE